MVLRIGHIRTFAASASILCSVSLIFSLSEDTLVRWLARAAIGFCFAILYIIMESWLTERSSNDNRGLIFSIYTTINLAVITAGQLALTLATPKEFFLFALAAILVSFSTVPVAMSAVVALAPLTSIHIRLIYLFERSPLGVSGCFGVRLANGVFRTLGPVFAQHGPENTSGVAIFLNLAVIPGALSQLPLGNLSDRMDRRRIIMAAGIGAAAGAGILLVTSKFWPSALYWNAFVLVFLAFPSTLCVLPI
jgi:MFS family permease